MKRVLIVDDETSFLLSLKDGLNAHRDVFQVVTAENGRKAVAILRNSAVDLLVTDLKMPEMDGFELLAWVSRERPELPVIVMTAFGTAEIESDIAAMGALKYLEKPLDLKMFQEAILNCLGAGTKSYIHGITLASFLQLLRSEKKTCTLRATSADQTGYLYIRSGELLDAELGKLSGRDAALAIVVWENAGIEMEDGCLRQTSLINQSIEHILIEAFQRKDEASCQPDPSPRDADDGNISVKGPSRAEGKNGSSGNAGQPASRLPLEQGDTVRKRLINIFRKNAIIREYVLFDEEGTVQAKSSGSCSSVSFDPALFLQLMASCDRELEFGSCRALAFNMNGLDRCLLFPCGHYQVLIKLRSGIKPQRLVREISNFVIR